MRIQSYTFIKNGENFEYVVGDSIKTLSPAMMECFDRQFAMMGFHKREIGCSVAYGKIEEDIDEFMKKVSKNA